MTTGELSVFWFLSTLRVLELEAGSLKDLLVDREDVAFPARYFEEKLPLVWPWLGRLANITEQLAGDGYLAFSMSADNVAKDGRLVWIAGHCLRGYPRLNLSVSSTDQPDPSGLSLAAPADNGKKEGSSILWKQGGLKPD